MEKKAREIFGFFDLRLKHSRNLVFMDGDMFQTSLSFASSYGRMIYVNNTNNETNKRINLICNHTKWDAKLHSDLENFYKNDSSFRVCIVSQSSNQALSIEEDCRGRFPYLNIKRLIGMDSGRRKRSSWKTSTRH